MQSTKMRVKITSKRHASAHMGSCTMLTQRSTWTSARDLSLVSGSLTLLNVNPPVHLKSIIFLVSLYKDVYRPVSLQLYKYAYRSVFRELYKYKGKNICVPLQTPNIPFRWGHFGKFNLQASNYFSIKNVMGPIIISWNMNTRIKEQ